MVAAIQDRPAVRPACPRHPGSRVRLDGFVRCGWSVAHRRPRYRCVTEACSRGHSFSLPIPVRQPSEHHPDSGLACPRCEHVYERHEGVKTGRDFVFGHAEIARLFLRIGEGMSLRQASADLRRSIFRVGLSGARSDFGPGETSRQANLAVNYVDAFAPAVIEALQARTWPRVIIVDATTLMTRGYRTVIAEPADADGSDGAAIERVGNLKAGTILAAFEPTGRAVVPCLLQAHGGKDVESWKAFFASLDGAPEWVVADLDWAIARAVRETWPDAIIFHSRHHLSELLRERAKADGIPEWIELDEPITQGRPITWMPTDQAARRYGEHPLFRAIAAAQRGPDEWAQLRALVDEHVAPDRLALRSWMATNELLIERQWRIAQARRDLPRSTGTLEARLGEWLAPLRRRAGRWQNARRLNLVLGLMTLRGRGAAHEARYTALIRARFAATDERSHLPDVTGSRATDEPARPMSWWRTWHDRVEPSLPRLVFESDERTRRRVDDDHRARLRERLAGMAAAEANLRGRLGIPSPPRGRPKRPADRAADSVGGKVVADFPDLLAEWAWDVNGDLDPRRVAAGGRQRTAWRCRLNPDHVWETRVADRTTKPSACPFHMGIRVHPAESLAAYFPWLAREWHPTHNVLRPDQVPRASGRAVIWRCELGHEWSAVVYARTRSRSGCPTCYRGDVSERVRAGKRRARLIRDEAAAARVDARLIDRS
jgi:hypothetical protein